MRKKENFSSAELGYFVRNISKLFLSKDSKLLLIKNSKLNFLLILFIYFIFNSFSYAQVAPGGVVSGTTRGWKVSYFNGSFGVTANASNAFGTGSTNTTPADWAYTGYVSGQEFYGLDSSYYGLEYSGILEVPQDGTYSFNMYQVDEYAKLFVDGIDKGYVTYSGGQTITINIALTAGDHSIAVKFVGGGSPNAMKVRWSGPGITANSDLDGRFVRNDNATLVAWYKATDLNVTPNYSGTTTRVNSYINKAPGATSAGNMDFSNSEGWTDLGVGVVNFNSSPVFNGNDYFTTDTKFSGLSFRTAPRTFFTVADYTSNTGNAVWLGGQAGGNGSGTNAVGFYKNSASLTSMARQNDGSPTVTSTYTANEPKLLIGDITLGAGNTASANNSRSISANGGVATVATATEKITNYNNGGAALEFGAYLSTYVNGAYLPEFIYYPFELNTVQKQKVNTYLAIKYGITLQHNYISTNGTVLWDITANASYPNRIFGIGNEMAVEGLNQKQSQSQMASQTGIKFLVAGKGGIATTNDSNTGTLNNGDYLILGDNAGALAAQSTELPASYLAEIGCAGARIGREWKVETTGNPGGITLRAGSSDSYVFPAAAAGIVVLIDGDGDGDFTTGTVTTAQSSSVVNGVATFDNVTIPDGAVITFAWTATAPGGVAAGLAHWLKADANIPAGNMTSWADNGPLNINMTNYNSDPELIENGLNYNPIVDFDGNDNFYVNSTFNNAFTAGEVFALGKAINNNSQRGHLFTYSSSGNGHYTWDNGAIYEPFGTTDRFAYNPVTGAIPDGHTGITAIAFNYSPTDWNIHNIYSATNNWGINVQGRNLVSTTTNTTNFTLADNNIRIGSGYANYGYGQLPEIIYYSRVLTPAERSQVQSYLAIKYGLTLNSSIVNYIASNGSSIFNYTSHWRNVFGIGRDDCSGLVQKQSKSSETGDNVSIGLNTIATTNKANTGNFSANRMFLMIGHDGAELIGTSSDVPANYAAISCAPTRYAREWKAANSNSVGPVQVKIGNSTFKVGKAFTLVNLAVDTDGDGNFATGTTTLYQASSTANGVATFNNVILPNGAIFTMCWTNAAPGGITKPSTGTDISGINYNNGLYYKLYTGDATSYPATNNLTVLPILPGSLSSNGYIASLTDVHTLFENKITTYFGLELTGKIYIPTTSATWQFRGNVINDQFDVKIDGVSVVSLNTYTGSNTTSANINLTAGYHDIVVRFAASSGGIDFDVDWNGGSGSTFSDIPDANFFTIINGPSGWFSTDDTSFESFANGATISSGTVWTDITPNGNDVKVTSLNTATYNKTSSLRNFNEQITISNSRFTNQVYLKGFAYGRQSKSFFGVQSINTISGYEFLCGYGHGATGNLQNIYQFSGNVGYGTYGSDLVTTTTFWDSNSKKSIIGATHLNSNISSTNNSKLYGDGKLLTQGSFTNWSTEMTGTNQLQIGNRYDAVDGDGWSGEINELIFYPWQLNALEQQKVNTYLAIKWGLTLDQTTPTNYIASDGTVIWDVTANTGYNTDMTGIGRDDCGALNQVQSTSTDANDIISFGRGEIAVSNTVNTNSFANDKEYSVIGHNNGVITSLQTTVLPTDLQTLGCYQIIGRTWKAQVVGASRTIDIQVGKSGLFTFNKTFYRPKLIISNSDSDWSTATVIEATAVTNGIASFDEVTITNGQFFTIAIINAAPGGVKTGLAQWMNADDNIPAGNMTEWKDSSINNVHMTSYGSDPSLVANGLNFNPVVDFDGDDHFYLSSSFNNAFTAGEVFGVGKATGTTANRGHMYTYGGNDANHYTYGDGRIYETFGTNDRFGYSPADGSINDAKTGISATSFNYNATNWNIHNVYSATNNWGINVQGRNLVNTTTNTIDFTKPSGYVRIGSGSNANFYGQIPEVAYYSRVLLPAERNQVQSYLAIKYGLTLHSSSAEYVSSNGTLLYNDLNYWNRITGIGRDDCEALEQKQSKSTETGSLVTISNGTTIATNNDLNTNTFTDNKSYILFGDNNKPISYTGIDELPNELARLNRVWHVKETGNVSTVYVEVPGNSSALPIKLPLGDLATDPVYLVVANNSSNGNFALSPTIIEMIPDIEGAATKWSITYDFADGDYFTFATKKSCLGPAGITDGLASWYKTNNKVTGTLTASTGTLVDETGGFTLTRNASGTATIVAGNATTFNYNNYLNLTGNASLLKGSLSENSIVLSTEGSIFAVGTVQNNLFVMNNVGLTSTTGIQNLGYFNQVSATLPASVAGIPNIYGINAKVGSGVIASTNGAVSGSIALSTAIPTANTYTLALGANGSSSNYNNGRISEAMSFNRELLSHEREIIDSYLAIKYGLTIAHNYYHPKYDGTNASTHTLYDISNYGSHVFGIGRDDKGCLSQNQSTSQNTGSMLKISVDGIINTTNSSDKTKFQTNRSFLLMGDDNASLNWIEGGSSGNREKPYVFTTDTYCDKRINRQWKVQATNIENEIFITIPASTSTATTKLNSLDTSVYRVVMLVNENEDFSSNANQKIVAMTLNTTTNEYEGSFAFKNNATSYITFGYVHDLYTPEITENQTICSNEDAIAFTTTVTGAGTLTYQWQESIDNGNTWNNITTGGSVANYDAPAASLTTTTQFRVIVTSTSGANSCSRTSNVVTVTVNPLPTATISGTSGGASCSGGNVTFNLSGTADAEITYNINGNANQTITLTGGIATINLSNITVNQTLNLISVSNGLCIAPLSENSTITIGASTTWNGTVWSNGQPTSSSTAIISGNYSENSDITACSLTVTNNAIVVIPSGYNVTLNGSLTVDPGSFVTFNNNANLLQLTDVANTGSITVKRNTNPLVRLDYNMWGSPVSGQNLLAFSPSTLTNRFYSYNTSTNLFNGVDPSSTSFTPGTGFLIRLPNNHPTTPTIWTGSFTGVPNNGNYNIALNNFGAGQRYNIVGNPYPSPINMTSFVSANSSNITGTIYFWRKSNSTSTSNRWSTWNSGTFVPSPGPEPNVFDPNGIIRTGQGFMIEATPGGSNLLFTNGMRVNDNANQFFRLSSQTQQKSRIWINVNSNSGHFCQSAISYLDGGTTLVDSFDGKNLSSNELLLTSKIEGTSDLYTIQSRPLPFDDNDVVPLSFSTQIADNFTISIDHKDGIFNDDSQNIFIHDIQNNIYFNINNGPYNFISNAGEFHNRFEVVFKDYLSNNNNETDNNSVNVFVENELINVIEKNNSLIHTVKVFDIKGSLIYNKTDVNSENHSFSLIAAKQVLIVEITLSDNKKIFKKIIY